MRVAIVLERFAIDCADMIGHNELHTESEGHAGISRGKLPPLGDYPTDAEWKVLDRSLSSRALSFPNELLVGEQIIRFWRELEPGGEGILLNTCNGQAGKCGYRAWQLAIDMRRYGSLPEFEERPPDFVKMLEESYKQELSRTKDAEADRERHEARSRTEQSVVSRMG